MATTRPPVIPEIAKAYQNDPRTQMAIAAMKQGTSVAPVAAGNYGYADGIARVLQGLMGGIADRKNQAKYGDDEKALLALRQARGVDGLNGVAPVAAGATVGAAPTGPLGTPMGSPGIAGNAPAIASALGAPAPDAAPPGPPAGPPGMPPAAVPPMAAPGAGGGPVGRVPFGNGSASAPSAAPAVLGQEPVPEAPAPIARPVAPAAVGPTRSRLLDAAYRIMADANPYESAGGQDMYVTGLGDQTKLDESAAERKQRIADMTYSSDLGAFTSGQAQDRQQAYSAQTAAETRNFESKKLGEEQGFKAGESAKERQKDIDVANIHARAELAAAKMRASGGGVGLTDEESAALSKAAMEKRLDISKLTRFQAKNVAMALVDADRTGVPLDAISLHAYANLSANPSAQSKAMMIEAAPSIINNMRESGKKVNFSDVQFLGKAQAFAKGQLNDPDFRDYMANRADVVQTLAQIMRGTGATDKAVALETDAAPKTMSPRAFDAWSSAQFDQLLPRVAIAEKRNLITHEAADAVRQAAALAKTVSGGAAPAAASPGWGKMVVR